MQARTFGEMSVEQYRENLQKTYDEFLEDGEDSHEVERFKAYCREWALHQFGEAAAAVLEPLIEEIVLPLN